MSQRRIRAAFEAVDRRAFLPPKQQRHAQENAPLSIGHGQTNSQPSTVGAMLELLEVEPGHRVLDVGSGSGWTTALLAQLVGPTGQVVGVERVGALAEWGAQNLEPFGFTWASIHAADPEVLGRPDDGPFDRILVSAGADELPEALVAQLDRDGVLVVPVARRMLRVRRFGDGTTETTDHGAYAFVPLHVPT